MTLVTLTLKSGDCDCHCQRISHVTSIASAEPASGFSAFVLGLGVNPSWSMYREGLYIPLRSATSRSAMGVCRCGVVQLGKGAGRVERENFSRMTIVHPAAIEFSLHACAADQPTHFLSKVLTLTLSLECTVRGPAGATSYSAHGSHAISMSTSSASAWYVSLSTPFSSRHSAHRL